MDGYLDVSTNKEYFAINDALIGRQFDATPKFIIGYKRTPRCVDPEAFGHVIMFGTANLAIPNQVTLQQTGPMTMIAMRQAQVQNWSSNFPRE